MSRHCCGYLVGVGPAAGAGFFWLNRAAASARFCVRSALVRSSCDWLVRFMLGSVPNTPAIVVFTPSFQSNPLIKEPPRISASGMVAAAMPKRSAASTVRYSWAIQYDSAMQQTKSKPCIQSWSWE